MAAAQRRRVFGQGYAAALIEGGSLYHVWELRAVERSWKAIAEPKEEGRGGLSKNINAAGTSRDSE